MKKISIILLHLFLLSCSGTVKDAANNIIEMPFNETGILKQLDLAFNQTPSEFYPQGRSQDIKYNFLLDLEHGYCETAGSRIHLYADSTRWAIVFEKSGYLNRGTSAEIELNYVGNCINYPIDEYPDRNYITNSCSVLLIDPTEFERIKNKDGEEMETMELIRQDIQEIKIRDKMVPFDNNYENYAKVGVKIREYDNPNKLIGFGDLIRFLHETNPAIISASENDILKHIPIDMPKLMTIDEFHFVSAYERTNPPSHQETYKLIAKILTTRDTSNWNPTNEPNNSWKNWESGYL